MSELKNLNRKRGSIKARLTNFTTYLDELIGDKTEVKLEKVELIELESKLNKLQSSLMEFDEVQRDIELIVDDKEYDVQIEQRLSFEDSFHKIVAVAKKILVDNTDIPDNCNIKNNSGKDLKELTKEELANNSLLAFQARPKLPAIPLPKFDGKSENWLEFRDTFCSLIHKNENISDVEKFHFLKGALEGEARQVIHLVDVSEANYTVIWDLLCERYNNTSMLVNNHLKSLFGLPTSTRESAAELRNLMDVITKHLHALQKLEISVESWDPIIIYIMTEKVDPITHRVWEERKPRHTLPTLQQFREFLKCRIEMLLTLEKDQIKSNYKHGKYQANKTFLSTSPLCSFCKNKHYINNCPDFLNLSIRSRFEQAKRLGLCLNCLKKGNHISKNCEVSGCKKCRAKHHILLHYDQPKVLSSLEQQGSSTNSGNKGPPSRDEANTSSHPSQITSLFVERGLIMRSEVLLSTALVQIVNSQGYPVICRVLLDSGSQSNLITEELCGRLGLNRENIEISIMGVNQVVSNIKHKSLVNIQSLHNNFNITVSCLVVPQISESIPGQKLAISHLDIPSHLKLADPGFYSPGSIDILLGTEVFFTLLCIGQIKLGTGQPSLQKTRFGWVVTGSIAMLPKQLYPVKCNVCTELDVQSQLAKFWSLEEPPSVSVNKPLSQEDIECERLFQQTTNRSVDGRFIVEIPLHDSPLTLGNSKQYALNRFLALERRFINQPKLKEMYVSFMEEYAKLGHMSMVTSSVDKVSYYLPHHGVINENSSTTKLRVVFNGSARSDNGISFNDLQYTGPTLQDDLLSILLRFRRHNVVLCADVEKMYRMILVKPEQRSLQKILWRTNPEEEIKEFELNTVTYGTKSAPYLAIRCLRQLGLENSDRYPRASQVILNDFYVDDMLTGASTCEEAVELGNEVSSILKSGGMHLRKWISNDLRVVEKVIGKNCDVDGVHFGEKGQTKTLGLYWFVQKDVLMYSIKFSSTKVNTKRSILSDISKIYDPLGLLGPCIIMAKILLQDLWGENISWDETLPMELNSRWNSLKDQFFCLNNLTVQRQVICREPAKIDIHGFSDASIEAYGACVYVRSVSLEGDISVALVCSKVKVAPLKPITVPRLELCGALLLANLVTKVKQSMGMDFGKTYLWCDSTVVLGWIHTSNPLQTFVRNRVGQILELTNRNHWHYVKSAENPADILSRGLSPKRIMDCRMWWQGPEWLTLEESFWLESSIPVIEVLPEVVKTHMVVSIERFSFEKFSCLDRLSRGVAHCLRFRHFFTKEEPKYKGYLRACEVDRAMKVLIKISQKESFMQEFSELEKTGQTQTKNIASLNPFIDENGFLRVGGRLQLSDLDYAKKHPLLLSSKHRFTVLLFEKEHKRLLHAGPQLLLSSIRENYWVIGGRTLANKVARQCVKCFRANPKPLDQIMGNLPKQRVCPQPPFHTTGLDYAGPFSIKTRYGRGAKLIKSYLCIFVCLTTRAVHLEAVSDLTTEAFIAAFRRCVSRRGKPLIMYSDNGTNLVGANRELQNITKVLNAQADSFVNYVESEQISWRFIPANSPNFGGLWEAGVKSCKYHLKRVMGISHLTLEDFSTLLTQVEAVLNSRPLLPLSSNPNDFDVLTPSHFLIGRRITALPDLDVKDIPLNRLSRYQHIQSMLQHFWDRWRKDYLSALQHRSKWTIERNNLQIGQLVIIKDENRAPLFWKMGRIVETFPGPDGKVRVARLKTQCGELKRAVSKLCAFPSDTGV